MAVNLPSLLIGQYQSAPRLRALIDIITADRDNALAAVAAVTRMLNLDTAEGVWLDYLAARIGFARPATSDAAIDKRFGFDMAGEPFDQQPFRGDSANDAVYPLGDDAFRRLIKARALLVTGDGTTATFTRAVREIDPSASVQDQRDMTVRVVTELRPLLELADECGALPRTAGVQIIYADRGRFGYDLAGVGFDRGPYMGG